MGKHSLIDRFMPLFLQIMKFGIVGIFAFAIDYSLLYVLTEYCGFFYLLSAVISFIVSITVNYLISMRFVFEGKDNVSKKQEFITFVALSTVGLVINEIGMWLMVETGGLHYMFSKIIVTVVVMVYNFVTRKIFIERKQDE